MLKIGLTGSIAVGKTYVCEVFEKLGCSVLDADLTAREIVKPNTEGLGLIVENFGKRVLQKDGSLDRKKLGEIVFSDREKRQLLNSILHPLVIDAQNHWLNEMETLNPDGIAIVDASLMIESGSYKRFDKLVVVWCDPVIQLKRLMLRDNLSKRDSLNRINAQMSQRQKKSYGDFLIDTGGGFESTREQTTEVLKRLERFLPSRCREPERNV